MTPVTVRAFPVVGHAVDPPATAAGGISQAFLTIDAVNHNNLLFSAIPFNIARHFGEIRRKRLAKKRRKGPGYLLLAAGHQQIMTEAIFKLLLMGYSWREK